MRNARAFVAGFVTVAVAVLVTACATAAPAGGARQTGSDVIRTAELVQHLGEDLYTFIQRARPAWLQTRAPLSAQGAPAIVVVLDGVPQEPGLDRLRTLRASDVQEVRRLSATDATTRFGTGMTAGAILVATKH